MILMVEVVDCVVTGYDHRIEMTEEVLEAKGC